MHKATAQVMSVLQTLLTHGGWLSTRAIADHADVPRTTLRDMLAQLESSRWVESRPSGDGGTWWRLGPELPRIGLAYQRLLVLEAEELRTRMDRALPPQEDLFAG